MFFNLRYTLYIYLMVLFEFIHAFNLSQLDICTTICIILVVFKIDIIYESSFNNRIRKNITFDTGSLI